MSRPSWRGEGLPADRGEQGVLVRTFICSARGSMSRRKPRRFWSIHSRPGHHPRPGTVGRRGRPVKSLTRSPGPRGRSRRSPRPDAPAPRTRWAGRCPPRAWRSGPRSPSRPGDPRRCPSRLGFVAPVRPWTPSRRASRRRPRRGSASAWRASLVALRGGLLGLGLGGPRFIRGRPQARRLTRGSASASRGSPARLGGSFGPASASPVRASAGVCSPSGGRRLGRLLLRGSRAAGSG